MFALTYFLGYHLTKATAYTKVFNLKSNIIAVFCCISVELDLWANNTVAVPELSTPLPIRTTELVLFTSTIRRNATVGESIARFRNDEVVMDV